MSRADGLPVIALGAGAFALYLGWGLAFDRQAPEIFRDNDRAFDADTPNRIICLTRREGAHYLTRLHPLFVVLLNPAGRALRAVLELLGLVDRPGRISAIALTSTAAAIGVAALFLLLRRFGLDRVFAFLWSVLFALSSSQTFWGILPETFVFSAAGLLIILLTWSLPRGSEPLRVAAGVAAFGMAATNLALVALLPFLDRTRPGRRREALRRAGRHVGLVLVLAAALSILQNQLYPRTVFFFGHGGVPSDDWRNFVWPRSLADLGSRSGEVGFHVLLANMVAPRFEVMGADTVRPAIEFGSPSLAAHRAPGLAFALLWGVVLAASFARGRGLQQEPIVRALLVWLGLHAAMHFVFGLQLFLYSSQWTFAVILLAALAGQRCLFLVPRWRWPAVAALLVLAALAAANNALFLREVFAVFASP